MRRFAELYDKIDRAPSDAEKEAALRAYFHSAPPEDAAWALWFLTGKQVQRAVSTTHLRRWASELSGLPLWLVEECFNAVEDIAETIALLLPPPKETLETPLGQFLRQRFLPLMRATPGTQREAVFAAWLQLHSRERFLWNKLITGSSQLGKSRPAVVRVLAGIAGVEIALMEHRLAGSWEPTAEEFARMLLKDSPEEQVFRPYPFCLAKPLEGRLEDLGSPREWQLEWKWEGLRVQWIRRAGQTSLWSHRGAFVTASFPEIVKAGRSLPDGTVLDGVLLAWRDSKPLPSECLRKRLRQAAPGADLIEEVPVTFVVCDLLETGSIDWRGRLLHERRVELERLVRLACAQRTQDLTHSKNQGMAQGDLFLPIPPSEAHVCAWRISPVIPFETWEGAGAMRDRARLESTGGVVLKRHDSRYEVGCEKGAWRAWNAPVLSCEAVLIAARAAPGSSKFGEFTFAVWDGDTLVAIARTEAGLGEEEVGELDVFVRSNSTGKFGPARSVLAERVFELTFEGVGFSSRRKSGLVLRIPRMIRWLRERSPREAATLQSLRDLAAALDPSAASGGR